MTVCSVFKLNNHGAHTHIHIYMYLIHYTYKQCKDLLQTYLPLFELVWRLPRCVPFPFQCPALNYRQPQVGGSLNMYQKKLKYFVALLEQRKSLDWTKVCGICLSNGVYLDSTGACMARLHTQVSTFCPKNDQQPGLSHFDRWKTTLRYSIRTKVFFMS